MLQIRAEFTTNIINTLKGGAADLVNADLNEESANLLSLQTRQQLGTISTVRLAAAVCLATAAGLVLWSREERYAVTRRAALEPALEGA